MEWISKTPFEVLLLVLGALFLAVGLLDVSHLAEKVVSPRATPIYPLTVLGAGLIVAAIGLFILRNSLFPVVALTEVKKVDGGFRASFGRTEVRIHFGRLEEVVGKNASIPSAVVLLPANDLLLDDCLEAQRTACGAYVGARASQAKQELRSLISSEKAGLSGTQVEMEAGQIATSYGPGATLYLSPTGIYPPLVLTAIATKRASGLRAEIGSIALGVDHAFGEISRRMISTVYMPLLGAGEGGLSPDVALVAFFLSLSTLLRRGSKAPDQVHLVIFQASSSAPPQISRGSVRRILNLAADMHRRWK